MEKWKSIKSIYYYIEINQFFFFFFFLEKLVSLYNLLVVYCYNNFSKIYNLNYIGSLNDRVIT